mgnify:CR=1 FL=1
MLINSKESRRSVFALFSEAFHFRFLAGISFYHQIIFIFDKHNFRLRAGIYDAIFFWYTE